MASDLYFGVINLGPENTAPAMIAKAVTLQICHFHFKITLRSGRLLKYLLILNFFNAEL